MHARLVATIVFATMATVSPCQLWLGETFQVPPAGGSFTTSNGRVKIEAPTGVFATQTPVSVIPNPYAPESLLRVLDTAVVIGQFKTRFLKPVTLTISYDPASLLATVAESNLRLFRVVDNHWVLMPSSVDTAHKVVSGNISSPGTYGIVASTVAIPDFGDILYHFATDQPYLMSYIPSFGSTFLLGNVIPQNLQELGNTSSFYVFGRPDGSGIAVYVANVDGSAPTRFATYASTSDITGHLAPDDSFFVASYESAGVWHVAKTTNEGTSLLALGGSTGAPVVSHQGDKVAFADGGTITVVSASTGATLNTITTGGNNVTDLAFNHSGTALAFSMTAPAAPYPSIYTVLLTGTGLAKRSAGNQDTRPSWSPTDAQIVFYSYGPGHAAPGAYTLSTTLTDSVGIRVIPYFDSGYNMAFVWR